ncbi:MAG: PKD domain-containing protein [Thermoplasmata archaeon]|nr:MAG: PKD domain-containing protein [Thermoplasmata archaeon]
MDVRLDYDDDEFEEDYEDDFEDEIYEGEVVEVAEEMPPEEPPQVAAAPPPSKKPKPGVKKGLIIVTVVILVIIASIVIFIFLPRAPTDIAINPQTGSDGLVLNAYISSDSATESSGKAKITIKFGIDEVYSNNNWKITGNSAAITIDYNEFVVDNGEYKIFVEYEGVSGEATYKIDWVLKYITLTNTDNVIVGGQPQFTLNVGVGGEDNAQPKDAEIRISSIANTSESLSITSGIGEWETPENALYSTTLTYAKSGNYTVSIDIENNAIKSSSNYASYTVEKKLLINAPPKAKYTIDDPPPGNEDGNIDLNEEIDFDGSSSEDEGDLEYYWLITLSSSAEKPGVMVHSDTNEKTTYTFSNPGYYGISLTVTDQHGEINTKSDTVAVLS